MFLELTGKKRDIGRFISRLKTIVKLHISVKNVLDNGLVDYALFSSLLSAKKRRGGGRFTLTNVIVGKNRRGLKMDIPNGIDTGSVLITGDFLSIV